MDSVKNATAKTKVSAKGRIILPKATREKYKWKPGTELNVEETPEGVLLTADRYFAPTKFEDVRGMLQGKSRLPPGRSLSIEEMDQAVMTEARRRAREDVFGCLGPADRTISDQDIHKAVLAEARRRHARD
jgi:AbrB family looped-hinge helix DNA binding protein